MTEQIEKVACPHCGKWLKGSAGVYMHIKHKHAGKGRGAFKPGNEDDESFADRAIQAQIDMACGIPTDDEWLVP